MAKKLLIFCTSVLMALSASADPITKAKALQLAQEYLVPGHTMSLVSEAKPRSGAAANESAPYYVISRGENQGFVIVAGDDCLPEILGYTEYGDFDATNLPPALQDMLDCWQIAVETAQADGSNVAKAAARKMQTRAVTNRVNIAPFVTSHWGQGSPYNDNCPVITADGNSSKGKKALSGCVATAASQILYYWRRDLPSTLQATTPTYGYGGAPVTRSVPKGTPMKWDLMLDRYGSASAEFKQEVAEFVFAVGAATWLTYGDGGGEATSGQIGNIPHTFSAYFGMNGGTVHYRSSYSQEAWTQLIYDELAKGRPVMYTGQHPDQGGHAVFIHGYQASTDKFYFNFGWDGGSDGYYTTTLETGMNGFKDYQSALIGAYPKSWNIAADIVLPSHVYANIENKFTIKIKNRSTLPVSGLYLFASTSSTKPANLSSAKSSDTETVIPVDASGEVTLTAKPTNNNVWYITVTDANLNVLAQTSVEPETAQSDLRLVNVYTDASADTETFKGEQFEVVYNSKSNAYATIANDADNAYEGTMRMNFYEYKDETSSWETIGYKTGKVTILDKETGVATFAITNTSACPFEVGKHYIGILSNPVPSTSDRIDFTQAPDTAVRFILKDSDMEVVGFEDGCLTLKGHFDQTAFNSTTFAKKTSYKGATRYDLTQCVGIKTVYQDVNPNALYYVSDDSEATGVNVVKAGKCDALSLVAGSSFTPTGAFDASSAEITIGSEVGKWDLLTVPFAVSVPDGIIAREITSHNSSGITSKTTDVKSLDAGKTYLVMSSSSGNMTLTASGVSVAAAPASNADPSLVGTFAATETPEGSQMLNDAESQYFQPVAKGTSVPGLRGYWKSDDLTKEFRAYSNILLDPAYVTLAQSIDEAYQILSKYSGVVSASAYSDYLSEIHDAESEFSNRSESSLTSASQIKKYAEQLLADGDDYMKRVIDAGSMEIDFTGNIENPSFETKSTKGWTLGEKEGYKANALGGVYDGTSANDYRAVGLDGTYVFQSLIADADSTSVGISQTVEGLIPGYYRLTAMLGTDETSSVTLFAGDAEMTVNGHAFGHLYLTEAVIDSILVTVPDDAESGTLTIGVKEGRWYKADHFTLTCIEAFKVEEDLPDAIGAIGEDDTPQYAKGIYTLQGVKVSAITAPGIYIIDGKKVFVEK